MFGRKDSTKIEIDHSLTNSLKCTPEKVTLILRNLNPKKSTSPNNIRNNFLKICHETLGKCLALIFRIYINKNTYPTCRKVSQVTPFFKEGEQSRRQQLQTN